MPTLLKVESRPVITRSIATISHQLRAGKVAFYVGTGVDIQLCIDAGIKEEELQFLGWYGLIGEVAPKRISDSPGFKENTKAWPTETASMVRWELGDSKLKSRLASILGTEIPVNLKAPYTKALCKTLLKSNLIVTTNYTSYLYSALERQIEENKSRDPNAREKSIIVLDREDLSTFQFPEPRKDPNRIFLVYLHGRCSDRSFPVFDAWGYNVATEDDHHYRSFLSRLFAERSVITLGSSWADLPLRNEAALVFRTMSHLRPNHLGIYPKRTVTGPGASPELANAMRAAYGVTIVPVDNGEQAQKLTALSQVKSFPQIAPNDLARIADFFDQCGDYESPILQDWLTERSPSEKTEGIIRIRASLETLLGSLLTADGTALRKKVDWLLAARIERHLRHFLFLYFYKRTDDHRKSLWRAIAKHAKYDWARTADNPRLRFDFLCGQYEVMNYRRPPLGTLSVDEERFDKRLDLASKIAPSLWMGVFPKSCVATLRNVERLLEEGWESMASQLALRFAYRIAEGKAYAKAPPKVRAAKIVDIAMRAEAIARSVGCFRRQTKAETLIAMWSDDPQEARLRILNKLRAAETNPVNISSATNQKSSEFRFESGMVAGFAAGLYSTHIKSLQTRYSGKDLSRQLKNTREDLFSEAGIHLSKEIIGSLYKNYWPRVAPPDVRRFMHLT